MNKYKTFLVRIILLLWFNLTPVFWARRIYVNETSNETVAIIFFSAFIAFILIMAYSRVLIGSSWWVAILASVLTSLFMFVSFLVTGYLIGLIISNKHLITYALIATFQVMFLGSLALLNDAERQIKERQ